MSVKKCEKKPVHWALWVKAALAYLRLASWEQVAKEVGRHPGTLYRWREDPRWSDAVAEAERIWDDDVCALAKKTIKKAMENGDAKSAQWYLERRAKAFAPPSQRHEHEGSMTVRVAVEYVDAGGKDS